jgi:hypothetical protein
MKAVLPAFIGLLIALSGPRISRGQVAAKPIPEVTGPEYEVFSAYISGEFTDNRGDDRVGSSVSKIVIAAGTRSDLDDSRIEDDNGKHISWKKASRYLRKEAPGLQTATLNSFRETDTRSARLGSSFRLPIAYELVEKTEIDAIFEHGGWWTDYYKKYPNSQGFLTLSRVGFSADGKQAMFYAVNECGGKCGTGTYVLMEKAESHWMVVKEILMWIS